MSKRQVEAPKEMSYVTWSDERGKAIAMHQAAAALKKVEPVVRTFGSDIYLNIAPNNVSVRDSFSRRDYEDLRPGEALPSKPKDIIQACMSAYDNVGIVRNVIDLMADFAVQGLDIVHPNERIEKFFKEWFRKVDAIERSERFLNVLYRCGNVIVKRLTAKLKPKDEERLRRSSAAADVEIKTLVVEKREIPWRYTFLNPLSVDVLGESLAPFLGVDSTFYAVRIPDHLARLVKSPSTDAEKNLVSRLPADMRAAIADGKRSVPLDPNKVTVRHYKKDDWKAWATPMLAPILKDINMLEKMKLADLAALDGAISCIRVWKLGSLEHKIMPPESVILRLAEVLNNNVGGGVMDLVWGPDLELVETSTEVHRFLGESKYAPVLNAIFQGMGVPPSLSGSGQEGFTNNYISLKTLTERLEYGRSCLRSFWEEEIRIVQKAMGFRFPARVTFDQLLTDEAAEKQLMLHMWDRNLVSDEFIRDNFGAVPDIEEVRVRRENKKRKNGQIPRKASPFHDPMQDESIEKMFAQTGAYSPSEFGVELKDKKAGEEAPVEKSARLNPKPVKEKAPKGQPGEGRPLNSNDQDKRKQKVVKPRRSASAEFVTGLGWAEEAQALIARFTGPLYLKSLGKKTARELTYTEAQDFESFKFAVLCQFELGQEVTKASVGAVLQKPLAVPTHLLSLLEKTVSRYVDANRREPPVEVLRRFQASVYALNQGSYEEDGSGHHLAS